MKTTTLIQAQANVMKLTALTKGDTVKIIEDDYSGAKIFYGVVLDILNTGEKTYFQILKYEKSYNDISASIKTYSGEKDMSLFPATPEEIKSHLDECVKDMDKKIIETKKDLQNKIDAVEKAREFINGEMAKSLKSASFEEITQKEYDIKKEEKKKMIEELTN